MNQSQSVFFNKAYLVCFFLLGLFPAAPFRFKPILVVPLILVSVIHLFFSQKKKIDWKTIGISTGIFLIFFFSYFYTINQEYANKLILRLTPFLILPFALGMVANEIYEKAIRLFFRVFTLSSGLLTILMFVYAYTLPVHEIGYIYSHLSWNFWGYEEHPIYISLYLGLSLIYLFWNYKKTALDTLLIIILLIGLFFLTRKGNILGLAFVGMVAILSRKGLIKKQQVIGLAGLAIVAMVLINFLFDGFILSRFQEIFMPSQWENIQTSTGIRNTVYQTSLGLSFESPIWGYGLGSVQGVINNRLIELGFEELTTIHQYNAHNQYIQIILTAGYTGLIIFLSILFYIGRILIKSKSKLGWYIFLYLLFCLLVESLLERQNGIIITALFLNLFALRPKDENHNH